MRTAKKAAPETEIYVTRIRQGKMTVQDIRRRLAAAVRMQKSWKKIKTPYAKEQAEMLEHHIDVYQRAIKITEKIKPAALMAGAVH